MTKLMEDAIRALSQLPADRQDDLARLILDQIGPEGGPLTLSADERRAVEAGIADSDAGRYADEGALHAHLDRLRSARSGCSVSPTRVFQNG